VYDGSATAAKVHPTPEGDISNAGAGDDAGAGTGSADADRDPESDAVMIEQAK
jgi:hypothetical protein